jgi:hypothetical protein
MEFFRSLFGPSRDEIWNALSAQIGGEVIPGSLWKGGRVQARVREWTVTLDEYQVPVMAGKVHTSVSHTRMRAPFPNPSAFRFSIRRSNVFDYLGPLLGMQDIQVGHPEFDETFVIKGNDESAVQRLCGGGRLRALIMAQPRFQLSIKDDEGWFGADYPEGTDVLVFDVADRIREVERLKGLYDVFAETLHELSKMGVAGSGTGGVSL